MPLDTHRPIRLPARVCVPVAQGTAAAMLSGSSALLPEAPFQELRMDALSAPMSLLPLLQAHVRRWEEAIFLATCRRVKSGGEFQGTAAQEWAVLREAALAGCRIVDLAIESAEELGSARVSALRATGAAVMLSWHDFERTGDLRGVLERMRPFAPDLYKIVPTAERLGDTLAAFDLLHGTEEGREGRVVMVSMGEAGLPVRVLGLRAGSAFTFAAATAEAATAPGQIDLPTLKGMYRAEALDAKTRVYGVAGDPIRSSLSPEMQNAAFQRAGLDAVYLRLKTGDAGELLAVAKALNLQGASVTMPLKQAVLPFLQQLDPLAQRIGAVNTLRREADGSYTGFNTDAAGITEPLRQRLALRGARVLVLGAGGAARAAVFGCAAEGARVSVLNRSPAAAAALAHEAEATAVTRERAGETEFDVVINATPAGMRGSTAELPVALDQLQTKVVFDLVYNPLETPLLREARRRGLETISGVEMFVHQGARQFELWTGLAAPAEVMRTTVLQALEARA